MRVVTLSLLLFAVQDDPVQKLINDLKSEAVETRAVAEQKLLEIGEKAVPALEKALGDADNEMASRIKGILKQLKQSVVFKGLMAARGKKAELAPKETEEAVRRALGWLARHQAADGSWAPTNYVKECVKGRCNPNPGQEDYEVAVTGLTLAAFLGAGHTPASKEKEGDKVFGKVVKAGLDYLKGRQERDGLFAGRSQKYMYASAWATVALVEAVALAGGDSPYAECAKLAVAGLEDAQNPGKGWRYSARCGDNDTSVTMSCVEALVAARAAGIKLKEATLEDARAWFNDVTEANYYRTGYTHKGTGKVFVPGMNENFNHHETLTIGAAFAKVVSGTKHDDEVVKAQAQLVSKDLPKWNGNDIDFYYWHWGTMGMWQIDGPDGATWKLWEAAVRPALVENQCREGCASGSWDPVDRWSGEGGRIYATAMNALTLEVYYRYGLVGRK
jgi:hypothetical protein